MAEPVPAYTTKELSKKTWPDFERLFSQKNGWDHCGCVHFHRTRALPKEQRLRSRAERGVRNLREKKELVGRGRSHGILVYTVGKPVGWCQYGRQEELPRIDNGRYYQPVENRGVEYRMGSKGEGKKLWRITCFVVDKRYRQRGIASAALTAALEAIQRKGGGIVEAFPIIRWEDLCRARIRRCGHAPSFGNTSTHGTQSMFEKQGFKTVAPYGLSNVLMRRIV